MEQLTHYQGKLISYTVKGSGEALVFLHGYLETKSVWESFTKHFESDYTVICIDLPGHGKSNVLKTVHSMRDIAQMVKYIMDLCKVSKANVIGHSMGGYVALSLVDYYPENVNSLVMFSSSAMSDSTDKKLARNRDIDLVRSGKKEMLVNQSIPNMFAPNNVVEFLDQIEAIKRNAKNMTDTGFIASLEGMKSRVNNGNMMKNLKIPVLFIAGVLDQLVPIDVSRAQVINAKNLVYKELESSGHMGYIEEEAQSVAYLKEFLNSVYKN
jgi:pimeloyl-ACP methyl ester carboxylesterase